MSPRRSRHNRDLPPNLYYTNKPRGRYYYYRHPETGKRTSLGYDKAAAIDAANQVNAHLAIGRDLVTKIMTGQTGAITLGEYIHRYLTEILPARKIKGEPLSRDYLRETTRIFHRIEEALGAGRPLQQITQAQLAAYLNQIRSVEARIQHRVRLVQLYRAAISDGILQVNLAENILPPDRGKRLRERLDLEGYSAIFQHAAPAIQNAMELSLNTLQRRADIQKWQFKDQRDGHAYIIQSKTRKHGPSAWLRIPLTLPLVHSERGDRTLADLINRCRDDIPCPYLIHQRPRRVKKSAEKAHPFQLSRKQISDGFAAAREASGRFAHLEPAQRPTFHEIIALGELLRQKEGWSVREIQTLRGHTNARMTEHYLEGHEWTTVAIPTGTKKPQ